MIAGGELNSAIGTASTISGGSMNSANGFNSTVSGGFMCAAFGDRSVVAGGFSNVVNDDYSAISGGSNNTIYNQHSAIPGGEENIVMGNHSLVFGKNASTSVNNTVVFNWQDEMGTPENGTVFINSNGLATSYGLYLPNNVGYGEAIARTWQTHSDEGLKRDIMPIDNSLNIIQSLRPVNYNWLSDGTKGIGFIAQEVQQVLPELVSVSDNETGQLGVNYMGIIPVNTAAIQELAKDNQELASNLDKEVIELRAENAELRSRIERLEALLLSD